MKATNLTYQFKVALKEYEPEIWRCIVVPGAYTFWDLHVAVQDSMGWLDCHLHAFRLRNPDKGKIDQIGIPDDAPFKGDEQFLPGWEIPIAQYFKQPGDRADYEYDFGDCWEHYIILEKISSRVPRRKYPVCIDGARACPPEDCGGVPGYQDMLNVLQDPSHEEYTSTLEWVGGRYDPSTFDPKKVRFDNPKKRWRVAFEDRKK